MTSQTLDDESASERPRSEKGWGLLTTFLKQLKPSEILSIVSLFREWTAKPSQTTTEQMQSVEMQILSQRLEYCKTQIFGLRQQVKVLMVLTVASLGVDASSLI